MDTIELVSTMSTNNDGVATLCPAASVGPSPPTAEITSNANGKQILHQKRWVCDVCKVKWFLDFNEACAHEEQCQGTVEATSAVAKTKNTAPSSTNKSLLVSSLEEVEKGASPTITPPPQSKKAAAILAAARAKARGKDVDNTQKVVKNDVTKKTVDIEIMSDSDDSSNAVAAKEVHDVENLVDSPPDSGSAINNKRKSKRLRDATPPAKSNHHNTSLQEMNVKEGKPSKAAKKIKPTMTVKSTTSTKTKMTETKKKGGSKGGGQIASIFLSKSQQQQQRLKAGDGTKTNSKKRSVAETKVNEESKKRSQRSKSSSSTSSRTTAHRNNKREVLEIDSSSDYDDDEVIVVPKEKTRKKNVTLGLSKEELGEHRAADFFARRRKKAEEEKERQRKRDQERLARMSSKDVPQKSGGVVEDNIKDYYINSSVATLSSSSKVAAASSSGDTAAKDLSFLQSISRYSKDTKRISAPKFPCPSHIVPTCSDDDNDGVSLESLEISNVLNKTPKFQHSQSVMTACPDKDDDETMPLGFMNDSDEINSDCRSIFSSFFDCSTNNEKEIDESSASAGQLWVDKYAMRQIPDDVIGEDNKEASKKLIEFVEEWKVRRHKAMQSMGKVKRKNKRRKKKKKSSSYHGYNSDDSFLDDGGLENVFLISGPSGSGKTRLLHSVAEQCECVVIEINTAEQRSGQALKRAVQETTQSHSSLAMSKRKGGLFDNNADDLCDSDSDSYASDSDESKEDGHSLTIILIDEVDLLFDEDTAFWPALAQLSKKAKCPIVLTATSVPPQLYYNDMIRYKSIALRRPSPDECCEKIDQVRKMEGMTLRKDVDKECNPISLIAEFYECDIRKILNEMQLFRYMGTRPGNSSDIMKKKYLVLSKPYARIPSDIEEDCPVILDIKPRVLHRDRHTVLTIYGKNLFQTELFIGGKLCKHFIVVSDSKVVAVCPPCIFPEGVTRDAIYIDNQDLDCLSGKYAEVVLQKQCPQHSGLVLDTKAYSGSESNPRSNWNVEYDIPLRESKFDQEMSRREFIRRSKAKMKMQQQQQSATDEGFMSSEEEFDQLDPSEAPQEEESSIDEVRPAAQQQEAIEIETLSDDDAQALLKDALSNIEIAQFSSKQEKHMASGENLQQSAFELSSFANDLARFSDAALLESSFAMSTPPISGAVEGFGPHLFDSTIEFSDPTIDKLCKGKNKKPPSFETIYQTGVNDSGFFFGGSNSYVCHPIRPRERQLLYLSEMNSRGLGRLDNDNKEESLDQDSNSGFDLEESNSVFSLVPTRSDSEDDTLLSTSIPSSFHLLPPLLMRRRADLPNVNFTLHESPLLELRRNQVWKESLYSMYEILTNGKTWCFGLRHGMSTIDEVAQQSIMSAAGNVLLDRSLTLDYLPYLREIAQYENKARYRVQEMMKQNGEEEPKRKTRRSRRGNLRRHYLEEFYPGRFEGNIDAISAQLSQSYMS